MRCVYKDEDSNAVDRKHMIEPAVVLHVLQTASTTLCRYCTSHHDLFSQAMQNLLQQGFNTHTPKVLLQISAFCLQMPILHWIMRQGQ